MGIPGSPWVLHVPGSDRGPLLLLHDVQHDLRVRPLDVLHRDEPLDERVELLRVPETGDDYAVVLARDVVHVDDLVLPPDFPLHFEQLPLRDPDPDDREDVVAELLLVQHGDVPEDDPLGLQALDAVADRADAHPQLPGDVAEALPRVRVQAPQDGDVELVEEFHDHGGPRRAPRLLSLSRVAGQYVSWPFSSIRSFRIRSSIGGCVGNSPPSPLPRDGFTIHRLPDVGLPKSIGFWRFRDSSCSRASARAPRAPRVFAPT